MSGTPDDDAARQWAREYAHQVGAEAPRHNVSGIPVAPLYGPQHEGADARRVEYPGQYPYTRGIHPSMYRGRCWSQRQIVGLGLPADYNRREHAMLAAGTTGAYLAPCNSFMRGYDIDQVPAALIGRSGTPVNTVDDLAECLAGMDLARLSLSLGDNAPFTLSAMLLELARRRGVAWSSLTGTTNQSDYLSLAAANHMFFRLSLEGSRRLLLDHIRFMNAQVPRWNPLSVVGQHMQEAGATPAEAMGFALSSALQYGRDLKASDLAPDSFLPRFSFFFDVSLSFFEEIAKFRAGRRLWARIARERLGAREPASWRLRFHAQTAGVELTRERPLNNLSRVTVQAMAAIFAGCQSLHTDAYDEAFQSPTADSARLALDTQTILREEAGCDEVIDPLGGSYYLECLTDEMEGAIVAVMDRIEAAGGMHRAVADGLVQEMIGASALRLQDRIERGERKVVGVNLARDPAATPLPPDTPELPDIAAIEQRVTAFRAWKAARPQGTLRTAAATLSAAARDPRANLYAAVLAALAAGMTHGEVVASLQTELGPGVPRVAV